MPSSTMDVSNRCEKVSDVELPKDWQWQEADRDTALEAGIPVTATAVYGGADKDNYKNVAVAVVITRLNCDHKNTELRNVVTATCQKKGYNGDTYCLDCGELLEKGNEIELADHSGGTATCISGKICVVCGAEYSGKNSSNHTHTEIREAAEATCTADGYTGDTYCTDCKAKTDTGTVIQAVGHDYTSKVTTQPTKDREGTRTYTCTRCGEQYSESIPKLTDSTEKAVSLTEVKIKDMASEKKKQLTVSWNLVEGADGYEVIYASDKSFTKNKVTKKTTKTSLTLKKLNEKKTWYVKVRAYAKKGTETYTGKYSAARYIKLSQRPANVKKITVKAGTKKLSVTAGSVKGATGYEIVVSTDKAGKKTVVSKKAAKGKASFTKLGKKKTYYVTVRAYKKTKNGGYLYSAKKVIKIKTK